MKSARTALTGLELQSEQTENQLSILLGRNPGPIVRGRSLLEQELAARLPPGLPSTLLDRRPDIRQAEQQLIGRSRPGGCGQSRVLPHDFADGVGRV